MNDTPYQFYFQNPKHGGKGIPYGAGTRPDGTVNHGFRSLKGCTHLAAEIPELQADPALLEIVEWLNEDDTAVFTVGCVSGRVTESAGHRTSGYVEFAINDRALVADAINYFKLFWHFTRSIHRSDFAVPVQMHWQVLGATFLDARCDGMTCRVIINTAFVESENIAAENWTRSLAALGDFLSKVPLAASDRIY